MKLTNFGRFIREYRISNNILLKQMADMLGLSSAFLSAIENGNKPIPQGLEKKLSEAYNFSENEKEKLYESVDTTRKQNTIVVPDNTLDQMLIGAFCRNLNDLDDERKESLLKLLKGVK
ncbi:helix-turn-helix domain-containing protein [Actinobacillus equuli]|uniref:helix-turn-helix domain-containing protein n=1 Tax=Actinobacillus equuli TaxID=718 RepID=UPI00244352C0|nr:helix-turn-helix transcriptional regulator [Actinobacillus equuli]WGE52699.1 helix-turn-helix domain-containing protein [Actinobacillus equuli subsp. haemolyticus]WGE73141.1 helix-turn-helix domain-containing protein [Actinobacillus equuli subsp. haemolyticus]